MNLGQGEQREYVTQSYYDRKFLRRIRNAGRWVHIYGDIRGRGDRDADIPTNHGRAEEMDTVDIWEDCNSLQGAVKPKGLSRKDQDVQGSVGWPVCMQEKKEMWPVTAGTQYL